MKDKERDSFEPISARIRNAGSRNQNTATYDIETEIADVANQVITIC
jgi:hypothetical protein